MIGPLTTCIKFAALVGLKIDVSTFARLLLNRLFFKLAGYKNIIKSG